MQLLTVRINKLSSCVTCNFQYPGVANSINSDISNLMGILKVWKILPEGRFQI